MLKSKVYLLFIIFISALNLSSFCFAAANDGALAEEVLIYINQYRVQHGLAKLSMNEVISNEATRHSQAMAQHALPVGHDGFSQRLQHLQQVIPHASNAAENVAYNYKTARIVVDGWLNSPMHRHNIEGHFNITGIGIARDDAGRPYFTQLFLRTDQGSRLASSSQIRIHQHRMGLVEKMYRTIKSQG